MASYGDRPAAGRERGQASVALVAALPLLLAALAVLIQIALIGFSASAAAGSARAAARAVLIGADPEPAARRALPGPLRDRLEVEVDAAGRARVELRAPRLLPLIPSLAVSARTSLQPGGSGAG